MYRVFLTSSASTAGRGPSRDELQQVSPEQFRKDDLILLLFSHSEPRSRQGGNSRFDGSVYQEADDAGGLELA